MISNEPANADRFPCPGRFLYYLASNIAAVAGPQLVGLLFQVTGDNYRIMFIFSAVSIALAGFMMARVRGAGEARAMRSPAGEVSP